eukprot:snap_masked-scaffold_4-processed-gene-3.12-mRNA-1 protein AED:1.00 eAED:1.00 QI:0/-1/0/0/-1/1/1/0/106
MGKSDYKTKKGSLKLKISIPSEKKKKKIKKLKKKKKTKDKNVTKAATTMQLTKTEKSLLERKKQREEQTQVTQGQKTHKQKISEFNKKLSNLSPFHDLPRVGSNYM